MKRSARISLLLSLLLLLVLSLALTACGGDDDDEGVKGKDCQHVWVEDYRDTDSRMCGEEAFVHYHCTECFDKKRESLGAVPHPESALETRTGTAATCYSNGLTDGVYCNRCMSWKVPQETIPAGHKMEDVVAVAPTCTEEGLTAGSVCSVCGYANPTPYVIDALGHDLLYTGGVDVTCTTDGMTPAEDCQREGCGYHKDSEVIPHEGHDLHYNYGYAATCTSAGMTDEVWCENWHLDCGYRVEAEEIPALGHDIKQHATVAATCQAGGTLGGKYCDRCKIELTPTMTTLRADCVYDADGVCVTCGTHVTAGLTFVDYLDGVAVSGVTGFAGGKLVIPATHNGKQVLAVAGDAFKDNTAVTEVVLPSTVTAVGAEAFAGCTALEKVTVYDFASVSGFHGEWCDEDDVKIYATYTKKLNPFEAYLAALDRMQTNADRYRLTINQTVSEAMPLYENYESTDTTTVVREKAGDNWYEYVDFQVLESQGGQSVTQIQKQKTWYYNGKFYQDLLQESKQNNQTLQSVSQKISWAAGKEYMRSLVLAAGASLPRLDESYFAEVDYYLASDGTYTLRLVMDGDKMLEYVLSVMGDDLAELIADGMEVDITTCTYVFKLDGEGHLLSIDADCEMTLGAAGTVVMTGGGHSSYVWTEIGTLAAVQNPGTGYTDYTADMANCPHISKKTNPGKAPTCTEDGVTDGIYCATCYADVQAMTAVPALGHTDDDNDEKCDVCEGSTTASNGILYDFSEDGKTVTVLGIGTCTDKKIVLPAELYGMKVTTIAAGAFRDTGITEIVIPETVTEIGANALPDTLTRATAPTHLLSLLPKTLEVLKIKGGDTLAADSIKDMPKLWGVYVHKMIATYEDGAVSGCPNLTVVAGQLSHNYPHAFSDALGGLLKNASDVYHGASEDDFDTKYVKDGDYLYSFRYDHSYVAILLYFGDEAVVTAPTSYNGKVCRIEDGAYRYNPAIETLVIPTLSSDSLLSYYAVPYLGCENLKTLEASYSDLKRIDNEAFATITHAIVSQGASVGELHEESETLKKITYGLGVTSISSIGNGAVTEVVILNKDVEISSRTELFGGYRLSVERVVLPAGMQTLPAKMFYGASAVKSVVLPTAITEIPSYFFYNCTKLESVEIPEGVTTIGERAFRGCSKLADVSLPSTLREIQAYAFQWCSALTSVVLPTMPAGEELVLGDALFYQSGIETMAFPEGVVTVPYNCFYGCNAFTSVSFPSTLRKIGSSAFYGVTLADVTIPEGVTDIGGAFSQATLGKVNLPSTVTSMSGAFYHVGVLTVADGVTEIPSSTFDSSYGKLTTLVIGKDLVTVSDTCIRKAYEVINPAGANTVLETTFTYLVEAPHAGPDSRLYELEGYLFYRKNDGTSAMITSLGELPEDVVLPTLPNGETYTIGGNVFRDADIVSLVIPRCVTGIANKAFYNCRQLATVYYNATITDDAFGEDVFYRSGTGDTVVTIGKDVGRIPHYFFSEGGADYSHDSFRVREIVFEAGSTCIEIGAYAFYDSQTLKSLTIPSTVTTVGERAFGQLILLDTLVWGVANGSGVHETAFDSARSNDYNDYNPDNGRYPDLAVTLKNTVATLPEGLFGEQNYRVVSITFEEGSILTVAPNLGYMYKSRLVSLSLPASIKTIPEGAYRYCDALASVTLNEGLVEIGKEAFKAEYSLSLLTSLTLPSTLETIGERAFYYSKITSLDFPASLREIGKEAFAYSELTAAHLPAGTTTLGDGVFAYSKVAAVTLPTEAFALPTGAFLDCKGITEIVIPDSVTSMPVGALKGTSVSKITLPYLSFEGKDTYNKPYTTGSLSSLFTGDRGTYYSLLKEVTVTGNEIPDYAFEYLLYLTTVTLTGDDLTLGSRVFYTTTNSTVRLQKLVLDCDTLTLHAEGYSFQGLSEIRELHVKSIELLCKTEFMWAESHPVAMASALFCGGEAITELVIPEGVTEIKPYAFYGANFLTSVSIPGTCKTVGEHAFNTTKGYSTTNSNLTSITLGEGVEKLGTGAFKYAKVTELVLPSSLKEIGAGALYCQALTGVTFTETDGWYYGLLDKYSSAVVEDLSDPSAAAALFADYSDRKVCRPTVEA